MKRPALKNFRRIVVKVGSSLLIDSDAGEVRASWLPALAALVATTARGSHALLVVVSGPRPPETAARHAEAGREPGRRRRGPDRAGANLVGSAGASRHRRRADPGHA